MIRRVCMCVLFCVHVRVQRCPRTGLCIDLFYIFLFINSALDLILQASYVLF